MTFKEAQEKIKDKSFNKIGEVIFEAIEEDDNTYREIGKSFETVIDSCGSQAEYDILNKMMIAISGWSIGTLIKRMEA